MDIVWATRSGRNLLTEEVVGWLIRFLSQRQNQYNFTIKNIDVRSDHVRLTIKEAADPNLIKKLKGGSSYWLRKHLPHLRKEIRRSLWAPRKYLAGKNLTEAEIDAHMKEVRRPKRSWKGRESKTDKQIRSMLENGKKPREVLEDLKRKGIRVSLSKIYRIKNKHEIRLESKEWQYWRGYERAFRAKNIAEFKERGMTVKEIAEALRISTRTVFRHLNYYYSERGKIFGLSPSGNSY
jgi:REP element-mobilizing transposase RayT